MLARLMAWLGRCLLRLRYRVRLEGLDGVAERGTRGVVFLPNHPALIDPPLVLCTLYPRFTPRALADLDQVDKPVLRNLAASFRAIPVPSIETYGEASRAEVERAVAACAEAVRHGDNLLLYPAGRIKRSAREDLGATSAVETILRAVPEARIVLVRTSGLWGSSFSRASGQPPSLPRALLRGALRLLASGVFFAPRREVRIEFAEPADLPRAADRNVLNRYLEAFYNAAPHPNTYVPYTHWEAGGVRHLPEPQPPRLQGDSAQVPTATRTLVLQHLAEATGRPAADLRDGQALARDLGLDSLALLDLALWLQAEFGFAVDDATALQTVGDVLLAACGTVVSAGGAELKPVPAAWWRTAADGHPADISAEATIPAAFLAQARRHPDRLAVADPTSGGRTYRDIITAVYVLGPAIRAIPEERVGIMLPASVAAAVTTLTVQFAGKTPVMVNWTAGTRNLAHGLDLVGVRRVLTSRRLLQKLESQGTSLADLRDRFILLEDVAAGLRLPAKLAAALRSRLSWGPLARARVTETAVILFTSGSESLPKAVPLTHANLLANMRDVLRVFRFGPGDRMLGMLPPFHSFGINCTTFLPLCAGLPVVYHTNPTESAIVARLIEAYQVTILLGTPTFLNGILRAATDPQLASLRAVISGAEKCPPHVYETLARRFPAMIVLEGYGITECSPIVSANDENAPRPGTIGKVLPSVEYAIVDPEHGEVRVERGQTGLLLVRGPSIFGGYLAYTGPSPFVRFDGRDWYRTGDLVREDADGVLTFAGRLKRFAKLGGEMVSLPAIEEVLLAAYATGQEDEPLLAVECTPGDADPELVLFTIRDLDRQEVNGRIRAAGLSPLHNIRSVVRLEHIPLLGTGKTDYRNLRDRLKGPTPG